MMIVMTMMDSSKAVPLPPTVAISSQRLQRLLCGIGVL